MGKNTLLLFVALLASSPISAQTDTTHVLQQVDVTAQKHIAAVGSAVPVQQMLSGMMPNLGIHVMGDALKHFAGITVRDYGGAGGMKTVSVRGIGSRHTGVVYDGVPVSDTQTGEIDLSRFSLDNMQLMRLTIGDGDNIFLPSRSLASAATLEMQSREMPLSPDVGDKPTAKPLLRLGVMTGSWGTVNPSFFYGQNISRRLSLALMGDYFHADNNYPFTLYNGTATHREHRSNSRMDSGHGELSLRWLVAPTHELQAKAYYYDNRRQLPGIVHLYTNENDERLHDRNFFVQTNYLGALNKVLHLNAFYKYTWAESRYHNGIPSGGVTSAQYLQREHYASASLLYVICSHVEASYALDFFHNALRSNHAYGGAPLRNSLLTALQLKYHDSRLTVIPRLLLSDYHDRLDISRTYRRLSPSLSASFRVLPDENLYVRAFWKSIFRMPTFNELYFYHIGSKDLRPERTQQWNLGLTWMSRRGGLLEATLTADAYINKVKDKIVAIPFNMFVWHMMNLDRVDASGVDFTADVMAHISQRNALQLMGNYSLQRAVSDSDPEALDYHKQIAYTPRTTFSATLSWLNPWVNISMGIDGRSCTWTTNNHSPQTRMPGFAEMDVNLWRNVSFAGHKLLLKASLLNLLDHQYAIVAHYPMPGRSWRIGASFEF